MKSALWGGRVIPSELGRPEQVYRSLYLALSLNLSEPRLVPVHGDGDAEPYSSPSISLLSRRAVSTIYTLLSKLLFIKSLRQQG